MIVEGRTFVNTMLDYASFNPGRFVDEEKLTPYSLTLDEFAVTYQPAGETGAGQAGDFAAHLTTLIAGETAQTGEVRVNHPLEMAGDRIYLMGNGYAPTLTIRDADGEIVFSESVPFLPQDTNMTSLGVVKMPDGLPEQLGLVGFFYPTQAPLPIGRVHLGVPRAGEPRRVAQRLRGRPRDRRRNAAIGVHARPDRHDPAHRRQDRRRLDRARPGRDAGAARRTRHDHLRGRVARRGRGLRRIRQALRLAVDPPRCRRRRGCSPSRCSRPLGLLAALFVPRRRHVGQDRTRRDTLSGSSTRDSRAARTRPSTTRSASSRSATATPSRRPLRGERGGDRQRASEPRPGADVGYSMPETAPLSLDSVSVLLVWTAIVIYALAFIAYAIDLARRSAQAVEVKDARERELVGAGAIGASRRRSARSASRSASRTRR